jgi:alkylhydroperoxidase family enzyme
MRHERQVETGLPARSAAPVCAVAIVSLAVAMGIGRFAFTPLLPLMVRDGSLAQDAGPWLAASNYLGYLAGALVASRVAMTLPTLIRLSLIGIAATTAAMGAFDGIWGWGLLRFGAGVLSAWGLIATSAWALRHLAQAGRTDLAGVAFAGVGLGITLVGVFCIIAARPDVPASHLWLQLGELAAVAVVVPFLLLGRRSEAGVAVGPTLPADAVPARSAWLVICYGMLGFGYILPATFLPVLAREVVDDPQVFGLAWPVFGIAAAMSTVVAARRLGHANRLRVWAVCHLLMAVGVVLPSLWLAPISIGIAALLVGSTFMVVTMIGMQEARARAPGNPTAMLGLMTAAFAIGQMAGPVASGAIDLLPVGHLAALDYSLQIAAAGLALSAAVLWRLSRPTSSKGATMMQANAQGARQGFAADMLERLPLPARDAMSQAQKAASDAIIAGPRKAIFGPFVPLLQCPALTEWIGKAGEALRFGGSLPERIRELAICVVARETSNQFEWQAHVPKALEAGVARSAIDALAAGRRPRGLTADEEAAVDFVAELMQRHGVSDQTYAETVRRFGEPGTVELTALVGYFVMVCWIMNVARTPGPVASATSPLKAFPA